MTHRTVVSSTIERYLACEDESPEDRAAEALGREKTILHLPHALMLELAYPEMDFAVRWCWHRFGPRHGECQQEHSQYRVCHIEMPHSHPGRWTTHWFVKTDYDFGFNEWYFFDRADRDLFREGLSAINWGENYPKRP